MASIPRPTAFGVHIRNPWRFRLKRRTAKFDNLLQQYNRPAHDCRNPEDIFTYVRWLASTYIRQLRSGLPQCCMHEDILGMDGALLPGGSNEAKSIASHTSVPDPRCLTWNACTFSPQAWAKTAPLGTNPVSTYRHKAMASLRASATIMIRRILLP